MRLSEDAQTVREERMSGMVGSLTMLEVLEETLVAL